MDKYIVTIYYDTHCEVEVRAKSEEEAIYNAYLEAGKKKYDSEILTNIQSSGYPEVEKVS